jgi:Flp pilus assembly pilin Flp
MAHLYWYLRALLGTWLHDERAQDGFEYLLVVGVVSVGIILAMATGQGTSLISAVVGAVCNAIKGLPGMSGLTCPTNIV